MRPVPSPDGKHIAFVRRVHAKSVLYLYNMESGAQRPLFDGLDHDQQEAWAIFGLYPNFAWTPDAAHLIFWAQGGIWKLDISTKAVEQIPFEVDVEITVTNAVRYPQVVSPESFDVKMIRDAATSPDGTTLVFNAAGHLWKKSLPDGWPSLSSSLFHRKT